MSRMAADSTMFLTVKRLMALSLGTQREQLEQRTGLTWPRFFLLRPPDRLFLVCKTSISTRASSSSSVMGSYHDVSMRRLGTR